MERTRNLMNRSTRDCLVTGYEPFIPTLDLPDPDDRHVLAAAIVGGCDAIVTQNTKDFPEDRLAPFRLEAQHPDEFLTNHLSLAPGVFCAAVRKIRARLQNPRVLLPLGIEATSSGGGLRGHHKRDYEKLAAAYMRNRPLQALATAPPPNRQRPYQYLHDDATGFHVPCRVSVFDV